MLDGSDPGLILAGKNYSYDALSRFKGKIVIECQKDLTNTFSSYLPPPEVILGVYVFFNLSFFNYWTQFSFLWSIVSLKVGDISSVWGFVKLALRSNGDLTSGSLSIMATLTSGWIFIEILGD